MPTILHIFRKDAKHLWKEIGLMWLLLIWVTRLDCLRNGATPNSTEGWLNLLMPLAWIYLIGTSVLQDPVPGDRQFWLTLPGARGALLAEKVLFAIAFVHLPCLVANIAALSIRGVSPGTALPHLLEKQLFLLAVVTLPSLAVASLARNAMQFVLFGLATVAAGLLADTGGAITLGGFASVMPTHHLDEARKSLAVFVLAGVSLGVVSFQYRTRRTIVGRFAAVAGFLGVAVLLLWLLPQSSAPLDAALLRASHNRVIVGLAEGLPRTNLVDYSGTGLNLAIPYTLAGVTERDDVDYEIVEASLRLPSGRNLQARVRAFGPAVPAAAIVAHLGPVSKNSGFMILKMSRETYASVADAPITLSGHLLLQYKRGVGPFTVLSDDKADIPGLGKCTSSNIGGNAFQDDMLRLACESPDELPYAEVRLVDTISGREWPGGLGTGGTVVNYPRSTWLSPLNRRDVFFHLTDPDTSQRGWVSRAPLQTAAHYKFTVAPRPIIGRAVVDYKFTGVRLSKYLINNNAAR